MVCCELTAFLPMSQRLFLPLFPIVLLIFTERFHVRRFHGRV